MLVQPADPVTFDLSAVEHMSAEEILPWAQRTFGNRFVVVTSFQLEGMVLVDLACRAGLDTRIVTGDTGRLPEETFEMMERVRQRYGITIETVVADTAEVERMTHRWGPDLFRDSVAYRRLCCEVRKLRPLLCRLQSADAYAVGLRRSQSETRADVAKAAFDEEGRLKLSPLADWSREDVLEYTRAHNVPVHGLYEKGYESIGCAPCTRAVQPGEHERAGRWWWETDAAAECGLHFSPDGKAERTVDVLLREILTD